jgi:TP901 family phage tail tape measure protein
MAITAAQLSVAINTTGVAKTVSDLNNVNSSVKDGAANIRSFATGAAVLGVTALVGIGVASVKMASDFQSGMTSLVTGAGESQANLKMVSDGILNLATQTGTSTQELTNGMYMIESAGFHGADGLNVLKAAAEGAKVGNADLASVANGVTTALTDYNMPASKATEVTNTLVATVAAGKTHMTDLAQSLSSILPTASSAGVSLRDTAAAMATMTGEGTPAADAATYLRQTIMSLENPAKKGADALASVGLKSSDVAAEMKKSLPDTLQMITDAVGKKFPVGSAAYVKALSDIAGGSKQMQGMLELTGTHLATFKGNVDSISSAVKNGGNAITGWANVQQDFNFKMDQAKETLETLGIKMGTALLPALGKLMDGFSSPAFASFATAVAGFVTGALLNLINGITTIVNIGAGLVTFFEHNHAALVTLQTILVPVAGAIAGLLVFAFWSWAVAASAAAIATLAAAWPFLAIGAAIAAVVAIIVLAITHWSDIVKFFQGIWAAFTSWLQSSLQAIGNFFVVVWDGIKTGLQTAWNAIVNVIKIGAQLAFDVLFAPIIAIVALFEFLYNHNYYFKNLVDAITNFFKGCFTWLQGAWNDTIAWLTGVWNSLVGQATVLWDRISTEIKIGFQLAIAYVQGIWSTISSFFVNAWNTYIAGPLHTLWSNVSGVFSGAWNTYIAGPLNSIWTSISGWFTTLGTNAGNAGKNFITMLVNGILSGTGAIWNAVASIANTIWKALGFHSPPKEGPASDSDTWMPNMIAMMTQGLAAGLPKIQVAVNTLAQPIANALNPSNLTTLPAGISAVPASLQSTSQPVQVVFNPVITLDGQQITNNTMNRVVQSTRISGPIRSNLL